MKLKLALFMIFIMAILGSGYLYLKKDYKKEVEFVEYKSKDKTDYSNYVQLTPNIPKNQKKKSMLRRVDNLNSHEIKIDKQNIKIKKLSEREQAKKELKEELDRQMLEAMKAVD